jgi:hypothetical protein
VSAANCGAIVMFLILPRCLEHVVNLANVDIMSHITKLAVVESTNAIWEYDPSDPDNRVLGGAGLDVIATIRTLAIKVCGLPLLYPMLTS